MKQVESPQHCLTEYLLPYFEHKKYKLTSGLNQFRRTTSFGHSSVIFATSSEYPCYVEFYLGVRHHDVEAMLGHAFGGIDYHQNHSHTLIVSWKHLWPDTLLRRYFCKSDAEVEAVCEIFIDFMDHRGFDFLDKYKRLSELETLFNQQEAIISAWSNHAWQRCFRAMALAAILNRQNAEELFRKHQSYLISRNVADEIRHRFDIFGNRVAPHPARE